MCVCMYVRERASLSVSLGDRTGVGGDVGYNMLLLNVF